MKNKLLKSINLLLIILVVGSYFSLKDIDDSNITYVSNNTKTVEKVQNNTIDIKALRNQYHNNDIVAYIEIDGVLGTIVLQSNNNEYYLNHTVNKKYDVKGSVILDYRNNINDRKILLYGHSGKEKDLPFLNLNNYVHEDYYKKHDTIKLYTLDGLKKYKIFSSYIEREDFDYVNLKSFNGLTYLEHLNKLKNKSLYDTGISLNENDKVIILQTCSMNDIGYQKYNLVIGKELSN